MFWAKFRLLWRRFANVLRRAWNRVPQFWRYVIIITASFLISISCVLWAAQYHRPADGGRGGALATIIAFSAIFLRPDYGLRFYVKRKKRISKALPQVAQLASELKALTTGLQINSNGQAHQNRALVIASLIGTFFGGFGDMISAWICHCQSCSC